MKLSDYLARLPTGGRKAFAAAIGVSPSYLYQLSVGLRRADLELAVLIELESHGEVSRTDMRDGVDWRLLCTPMIGAGRAKP